MMIEAVGLFEQGFFISSFDRAGVFSALGLGTFTGAWSFLYANKDTSFDSACFTKSEIPVTDISTSSHTQARSAGGGNVVQKSGRN
jgi:hypothetical protein